MANALVISKQTGGYFAFNLSIDGAPQDEVRSIQNDLLTVGNTLHFKTSNGANIIKQQNITPAELTIIASGTFTFATVTQVWDKLIEVGFFDWLGTGGGAGVNRFDDLLDTFQYFGKDGYVCVVNESQQKLEAVPFYNYRKFTDLEDSPSFLVPNKMVVVNPAGTSLILQDQPPTPDTYLNSVGYFDYNDSITHTTPLAFVTNTPKKLTNDTLGVNTNTSENPYGVSFVWNRTNNQFDFSQLSIGDTIDIRIQVQVTTTTANQKFKISAKFGIGSVAQFENTILSSQVKTAGLEEISFVAPFYIGSSYIRDFPAELYITSDAGGTVVVDGWYIRILRKNINILTIESSVPDATTLVKGIVRLGGDLSGTADNPTVPALATKTANTRLINTTAPLSGGGDLSVDRTISIPQADTSTNGYLAGGDWTTFNNKQGAISLTTTGSSGASTFVANALNIPNYTLAGLGGQPLNSNLTSVSSLSYVSPAFVKMTGLNTFTLDTNTYLTSTTGVTTLSGGTTGLTPNTATSGAITLAGTLVIANGGTGSTTASGARTNLGATTVGGNVFTSANPTAITFLRANADNTVSWLDATTFRTAIGAGTSSTVGTVTSVSALTLGTTGTDLSSTVATGTTTPVITLNVPTASATNRGVLSSADWSTFNGKQNAIAYTPADDSLVVHKAGTETITGTKTFSASPLFDLGARYKTPTVGYQNMNALDNGWALGVGSVTQSLIFNTTTNYNYTYPNASGTLALTSDLSAYQTLLTNPITGTGAGTTNTIPKFTGVNALGNSAISDTGTIVSITNPSTTKNTLNVRNSSYDSTVATGTASLGFGFANHIGAKIEAYKQATNITGFKFYTENGFNAPVLGLTLANGGTGTFAGNVISNAEVRAGSDTQTASGLIVNGAGSSIRTISMRTAGSRRWGWRMDDTAESGSNVGSDLRLTSYTDANAQLADVLFVKRSTGNILINTTTDAGADKLQVAGNISNNSQQNIIYSSFNNDAALFQRDGGYGSVIRIGRKGVSTLASIDYPNSGEMGLSTNGAERINIASTGVVKVSNLAGTGTRTVVADASGILSTATTYTRALSELFVDTSNTVTTEQTLFTYTIPMGTLAVNGDRIELKEAYNASVINTQSVFTFDGVTVFSNTNSGTGNLARNLIITRVNSTTIKRIDTITGSASNFTVSNLDTTNIVLNLKYTASSVGGATLRMVFLTYFAKS